ncbi:hypothetical protein SporoP33_04580 [Sporosarcina sp. P33]|nr:hypothetical protein SporoP33_04580 [Sporosarcina sp. P33]
MIDSKTAREHFDAWLQAELQVSQGQSYTIGSRTLTRVHISEIRKMLDYWRNKVQEAEMIESGRNVSRVRRFIPRDL